jgi:hypothetical protein
MSLNLLALCCFVPLLNRSYKALYRVLLKQMDEVKKSCMEYNAFVSIVNIRVNNLQLEEQKPTLSYIESWFQEQQVGQSSSSSHVLMLAALAVECIFRVTRSILLGAGNTVHNAECMVHGFKG